MMERVTWLDCSVMVKRFIGQQITATELIDWSRHAMHAMEMPAHEVNRIMELLQDINASSPDTLRQAVRHYQVMSKLH